MHDTRNLQKAILYSQSTPETDAFVLNLGKHRKMEMAF